MDAIILNPVDTQGVRPMIEAAKRATMPLVFVNRKSEVKREGQMANVGSDSAQSGKIQMEALAKSMNYRGNEAVDVVSGWLLNGPSINNDEMAIGAMMALKQAKKDTICF